MPAWSGENDSVEARQNLDGSGQDQDELLRRGTTLICREESKGEKWRENIRFNSVFNTDTRCSADGQKRYGNDKCGRKSF